MSGNEELWVVGPTSIITLHDRLYALEAKVAYLTNCVSYLWHGAPRVTRGRYGVEVLQCVEEGKSCYRKPKEYDCGTLGTDSGCQVVSEKPETVEEE